ncbi:DUF6284 family protein [Plantactinospora endophytica]|uniref:Uncharacterized protein n=1 Tax=Plantactinospora endophytica TaxID=673535 RepID=A0ABQ4DRL9_9ACTN|nr:DUF6284 family protein [Plantactinospora endophytica]GIG85108.1 hypothetical protein Pen02_00440 [Plantactinospora endophytica]
MHPHLSVDDDPTSQDLAAIDREWPLIEAELALLDAEITALNADGGPSPLDRRRIRRAEQRVMREAAALGELLPESPRVWKAVA